MMERLLKILTCSEEEEKKERMRGK